VAAAQINFKAFFEQAPLFANGLPMLQYADFCMLGIYPSFFPWPAHGGCDMERA